MAIQFESLTATRDWLENLLRRDGVFFDADGVLRSAINARTLQPFTAEWARTQTQPRQGGAPEPLAIDYVAAHTYEDSWDAMGNYIEYLVARHNVTREEELVHEMRRIVKMATDVYREDNPDDNAPVWSAKRGFFRRLYAGRHGQWPYPEILGTDQMAPLQFGLLQARDFLDAAAQRDLDAALVGALGWYMTRNFAYLYRGTVIHHIDTGPHALSYYLPALVWAHRVTGEARYLKAYHRLHADYLYNPEWYLDGYEMPGVPTRSTPEDRYHRLHAALRWSAWVVWLSVHAPNANYYQHLFEEFAAWNTRLLRNTLPSGLGHDYDNMAPTTAAYPEEWIDQPLPTGGPVGHDGLDIYAAIGRARIVPFRKLREHTYFALLKPEAVDVTVVSAILSCCRTPDHFTYWYDPEDKIVPAYMNHRSWSLQAQFVTAWLTAYWRLRKIEVLS